MRIRHGKRALCLCMALLMCLTLLPLSAMAEEEEHGLADAYFFTVYTGSYGDWVDTIALESDGSARFCLSTGPAEEVAKGGDLGFLAIYSLDGGGDYLLMDSGTVYYGGAMQEGGLVNITIPDAKPGTYTVKLVWSWPSGEYKVFLAENAVTITGGGAGSGKPTISTAYLPDGNAGEYYATALQGSSVGSWSAEGLPDGLALDGATGVLSGTPAAAGSYTVRVTAANDNGSVSKDLLLFVNAGQNYNVNILLCGGAAAPGADYAGWANVAAGTAVTLPAAPIRTGFRFDGWSDGASVFPAGAQYTVTGDATLRAAWKERTGLKLSLPEGLDELVGSVWLIGEYETDYNPGGGAWLWSEWYPEPTAVSEIEIPVRLIGEQSFTGLKLYAVVDGQDTCIASYDAPVSTGDSVQMEAAAPYTLLSAIHVVGLTEKADYLLQSVECGRRRIWSAPCLVSPGSAWTVTLEGVRGSTVYSLIDWSRIYTVTVADHKLTVDTGDARWGDPRTPVSGKVTWAEDGTAAAWATVRASQKVGDIVRTLQTNTKADGSYELLLYPDAPAVITVQCGSALYITAPAGGASWTQDVADAAVSLDLAVKQIALRAEVDLRVSADTAPEALRRYLSAQGVRTELWAAADGALDRGEIYLNGTLKSSDAMYLTDTGAADALQCSLSSKLFETVTVSAQQSGGGDWKAVFAPTLKPGVVAELSAAETTGVCYVFCGTGGNLLGKSDNFVLYPDGSDHAAICPAETAKVVLMPSVYSELLALSGTTFDALSANGWALTAWDVTMAEGKIAALTAYSVDETDSMNAVYVTQPGSTLAVGADCFVSEQDLIRFNGSIGLDAGLPNGEMVKLCIMPGNGLVSYANTAPIQSLVVAGKQYTPKMASTGYYYVDFPDDVALPCDYTIFCTPGSIEWDMHLTVTADVQWSGGAAFSQLIGSAVVARPGAYLDTLSSNVNQDVILVSGVVQANEGVSVYDNGALIGTAQGDDWGEWTAQVTLNATDESVPTVHRIYAVSASGTVSDELTVIHDSAGPQLTKFLMSWESRYGEANTINIGDSYLFTGQMNDVTFEASFTNPEALETMEAWGCKAVFKVFTTDGEIRFLKAAQSGGTFTATVPTALSSSVTRAEVLYEPAMHAGFDTATMTGTATAADVAALKALAAEVKADSSAYPTYSYELTYDKNGKASAAAGEGTAADADFVKNLEESVSALCEDGVAVSVVMSDADYDLPTEQWLALTSVDASIKNWYALRVGGYAGENRMYTLSRSYTGGTGNDGEPITAAQAFALEKAYFDSLEAEHSTLALGSDGSFDLYLIANAGAGEDGQAYTDRRVTAGFAAVDGVYTATVTVAYSERVCLKLVRDTLDALYPDASATTAQTAGASAAGTTNAVTTAAGHAGAAAADVRLLDDEPTDASGQPGEVADVEIRYTSNFTPEMHAELLELRWERENLDMIWDAKELRRLAELEHAEANAMEPAWLDENNFHYNGKFKPQSNTGRTVMGKISNEMGSIEEGSNYANYGLAITGALADGTSLGESLGPANVASAAANIYANIQNTGDAKEELEMMRGDMEQIMSSPCYKKLTPGQKAMVNEAYDEFMEWYQTAKNHLTGVSQLNFAAGTGGAALGKNPLAGLTFAGGSWMVSNVGGKMIENSFGSAIYLYEHNFPKIKGVLRARSQQLNDPNCAGKPTSTAGPTDGNGKNNKSGNDPSGVVYEAVIENPVEGATVRLYYGANDLGAPVTENPTQLKLASDVRSLLPRSAVQVTGADGRYQWGVPEGLWYVSATYAGLQGDSIGDLAATVGAAGLTAEGRNVSSLLPVLPVQLDVNIPLTDWSAPAVAEARCSAEGVYVSFSKYMNEYDVLSADSFGLGVIGADAETPLAFTVSSAEQGHTPENRGSVVTYTRTVLLTPAEPIAAGTELYLTVSGSVRSYAGTEMGETYSGSVTAAGTVQLAPPVFDVASGELSRGTTVGLRLPDGAPEGTVIYYTTRGEGEPDTRYDGPIAVTGDLTIRAKCVCLGFADSAAASASYTVQRPAAPEQPEPIDTGFTDVDPDAYYAEAVIWAANHEPLITNGVGGGKFDPLGHVNRAQAVTFLWRAAGCPEPSSLTSPFTDVTDPGQWYYKAVLWAAENDITNGVGNGAFDLTGELKYSHMLTFLWRSVTGNLKSSYGEWYSEPMDWTAENGLDAGLSIAPGDDCPRCDVVYFLWKLMA